MPNLHTSNICCILVSSVQCGVNCECTFTYCLPLCLPSTTHSGSLNLTFWPLSKPTIHISRVLVSSSVYSTSYLEATHHSFAKKGHAFFEGRNSTIKKLGFINSLVQFVWDMVLHPSSMLFLKSDKNLALKKMNFALLSQHWGRGWGHNILRISFRLEKAPIS